MSFGQTIALKMVNKFVKFDENSLNFVKVMADSAEALMAAIELPDVGITGVLLYSNP